MSTFYVKLLTTGVAVVSWGLAKVRAFQTYIPLEWRIPVYWGLLSLTSLAYGSLVYHTSKFIMGTYELYWQNLYSQREYYEDEDDEEDDREFVIEEDEEDVREFILEQQRILLALRRNGLLRYCVDEDGDDTLSEEEDCGGRDL